MKHDYEIEEEEKRKRPLRSEVTKLVSDNKKARKILKWKPKYYGLKGFEKGLSRTIEWFSNNRNHFTYKDIYNK